MQESKASKLSRVPLATQIYTKANCSVLGKDTGCLTGIAEGTNQVGGVRTGKPPEREGARQGEFGSEPHSVHCAFARGTPLACLSPSLPSSSEALCSSSPARTSLYPFSTRTAEDVSLLLGPDVRCPSLGQNYFT